MAPLAEVADLMRQAPRCPGSFPGGAPRSDNTYCFTCNATPDPQADRKLSARATRAILRWERARAGALGPTTDDAPLFITLGRRRRDGRYVKVGGRCGQPVLAAVMQRLGAIADTPQELRHPHALRHTCARELLRAGATIADVLGHASIKTTSIYLTSDEQRQEDAVIRRERGRLPLDEDLDG
jgi:integrase